MKRPGKQCPGGVRAALAAIVALGAAAAVAACNGDGAGPTWTGSFTRAITTCGGSLVSVAVDPPLEATIESEGDFAAGSAVALFLSGGCGYHGEIEADGRLRAEMHPGCEAAFDGTDAIVIGNVFAERTTIHRVTDYRDPQRCDVDVWGEFDRH